MLAYLKRKGRPHKETSAGTARRRFLQIFCFPVDQTWLSYAAAGVFWAMTPTRGWGT